MADFKIRIASTDDIYEVPPHKSILDVLHEHGHAIDHSCTSGLCGTCKVRYIEGRVDHRDMILTSEEQSEYLTTCISRCQSDELLLDLPPPGTSGPVLAPESPIAIVDQDICVACLTCVRACTYGAAAIDSDAVGVGGIIGAASVDSNRCSGCGLCAAACPTGAISMTLFSDSEVNMRTGGFGERPASEPLMVIFACPHCAPAVMAFNDKSAGNSPIELEIIEMPCTGRIDNLHLMRTFEDGADGVIVTGCEPGRCYHSTGNINAARRTKRVQSWLDEVGLGGTRLTMVHLPARDGEKPFSKAADTAIKNVEILGPSPLRVVSPDASDQPAPEDAFLEELGLI
ncbi:MAG: hypothetical protein CMF69_07500 [Magnetovibrio sp.]|nr:hypothetical protein [Magnetovibrio sp.]